MSLVLLLLALTCGPPPVRELEVRADASGVEVRADAPLRCVEVRLPGGGLEARRCAEPPATTVWVADPLPPGARRVVRAEGAGGGLVEAEAAVPAEGLSVEVAVPGGGAEPVRDGARVEVPAVGDAPARAVLVVAARAAGAVEARVEEEGRPPRTLSARIAAPGARASLVVEVQAAATVRVRGPGGERRLRLVPARTSPEEARRLLRLLDVVVPADRTGAPDLARPAGAVALPSRAWSRLLLRLGLGVRARDPEAPWAHVGVHLDNAGGRPVDLAVRARVVRADGTPDPAFRPRVRGADDGTGWTSALVRVPPGEEVRAVLPLFVDEARVEAGGGRRLVVEVVSLGADRPLHRLVRPLPVRRGSALAAGGFAATLLAAGAGLGLLLGGGRRWLRAHGTTDLVTVALFGMLCSVAGTAAWLAGAPVAAVLGPFAPLLTALLDRALRTALLATLLSLMPRPGVVGAALVVEALVRGLTVGALGPVDLLGDLSGIAWTEGALWLAGLTRPTGWTEAPPLARWVRLSAGFGLAALLGTAGMFAVASVLYRLFFAGWYVALVLAGPAGLYTAVACALAVPFAESLRRVEG